MEPDLWSHIGEYLGRAIQPGQAAILHRFQLWLKEEAIPAGGVGPGEVGRLVERHIADSLLFYAGWDRSDPPPVIWDLGSGVGLPGIPLAVFLPESEVILIDRSGRRVDLAKRAVRTLDLPNVTVRHRDMENLGGSAAMLVSRASRGPDQLAPLLDRYLQPGGVAVVGGSWKHPPRQGERWEIKEIPRDLLDRPIWLLIMRG